MSPSNRLRSRSMDVTNERMGTSGREKSGEPRRDSEGAEERGDEVVEEGSAPAPRRQTPSDAPTTPTQA
jgi:hypothetical protein